MITSQHTITCDICGEEEHFDDRKLPTAIIELRRLGWIINTLATQNAICPKCAEAQQEEE